MDDEAFVLWAVTGPELLAYLGLTGALAGSLLFGADVLTDLDRPVRVGVLAVASLQWGCPLAVYLDSRRRGQPAGVWVHAAAVPVVGPLGVLAYLEAR